MKRWQAATLADRDAMYGRLKTLVEVILSGPMPRWDATDVVEMANGLAMVIRAMDRRLERAGLINNVLPIPVIPAPNIKWSSGEPDASEDV